MKTNAFLRLLLVGFLTFAVASARADEEQDLIALLKSNADTPKKCDACEKLRLVGTVKAVPALAGLLGEERISHAARYALEGMPCPEAVAALRQALGTSSGSVKAGLIDSLGWRRDAESVPLLENALADSAPTIASAAASALGRIGGKQAIAALSRAREKVPASVKPAVLDGLLRCADQLLAAGDRKGAAALCRSVFTPETPVSIRVAAWRGLVKADARARAGLVADALNGGDLALHEAALGVLRELNDAFVVKACVRRWADLKADSQLAVLDAKVKVGGDVLSLVHTATQSPYLAVRVAAWGALGDLRDPGSVPSLAKAAASGEPAEREAAREALARERGRGVRDALLKQLGKAAPEEKVELLRALGDRGDSGAAGVLLENAAADSEALRLTALDALRKIANPDTAVPLLELAANSKSEAGCEPVLKALYAVCQSDSAKSRTAAAVLAALKPLPSAQRRLVLPVLAELGTPAALESALAATRDTDPETVKEAVRVLALWPNAAPATSLLELARTTPDPVLQVLAVRGGIDVARAEPDYAKRLALLQNAMATAKRPDEKRQALGQIGQVPTPEALQMALAYLADDELANEAGLAAVTIAEKVAGADPKLARDAAVKLLAQCKAAEIVRRAWAIRGKPVENAPFIKDWLLCGPYSKPGVTGAQAVFDLAFDPEKPDGAAAWKPIRSGNTVDLAALFPEQFNCVAYLKTRIIAPQDCEAALLLGSDDGVKAWLNGTVAHSDNVDRGLTVDSDMAPIQLKQGANDLLLKITQGGGGWGACARIVGMDGRAIPGLQVQP
jgi:HEAT repeat protein